MDVQVQGAKPQHVAGVTDPGYSCNRKYVPAASALDSESVRRSPEISLPPVFYPRQQRFTRTKGTLVSVVTFCLEHLYPDR